MSKGDRWRGTYSVETIAGGWKCFFWRVGIVHLPTNGPKEHY